MSLLENECGGTEAGAADTPRDPRDPLVEVRYDARSCYNTLVAVVARPLSAQYFYDLLVVQAIAKQEELLRSMRQIHGEFHPCVSDNLAQLAMLFNMRGHHAKALTLLHKRLVIHEKHGSPKHVGEILQALGTTYRLQGVPDIALQHLERALATREACHGAKSTQVAETLNSLALLYHARNDTENTIAYQLRSLQMVLETAQPDDSSVAIEPPPQSTNPGEETQDTHESEPSNEEEPSTTHAKSEMFFGAVELPTPPPSHSHSHSRAVATATGRNARSKSDSAIVDVRQDRSGGHKQEKDRLSFIQPLDTSGNDDSDDEEDEDSSDYSDYSTHPYSPKGMLPPFRRRSTTTNSPSRSLSDGPAAASQQPHVYEPIRDAAALQARVGTIQHRLSTGDVAMMDREIARFASDIDLIPFADLRLLGETMVGLVREMHRLRIRVDRESSELPVLEGFLEKKSASIFRGWEKRFFKVDAKTFILSYHYSKEDCVRGFAPRGGFPIARISSINAHRQSARGGSGGAAWFYLDVVVDLSTRLKPHAVRTYELRTDTEQALYYWVETLQQYKATAQATAASLTRPT